MKYLALLLFIACASHHKDDFSPPKPFVVSKNMTMEQVVKGKKTEPTKCTVLNGEKYCQWDEKTAVHFVNDKAVKEIVLPSSPMILNINMVSLKSKEQEEKVVKFSPAKGSFLQDSEEWNLYVPMITKTLQKAGYTVTEDAQAAKQNVVLNYGLKTISTAQVNRFLKMFSYSNPLDPKTKARDLWRVELSSPGSSRDLKRIMPIFVAAAYKLLTSNERVNEIRKVSENDLEVIAFHDQAKR